VRHPHATANMTVRRGDHAHASRYAVAITSPCQGPTGCIIEVSRITVSMRSCRPERWCLVVVQAKVATKPPVQMSIPFYISRSSLELDMRHSRMLDMLSQLLRHQSAYAFVSLFCGCSADFLR
jgi:hypothetical protein